MEMDWIGLPLDSRLIAGKIGDAVSGAFNSACRCFWVSGFNPVQHVRPEARATLQ
jgi:hypothetical protein